MMGTFKKVALSGGDPKVLDEFSMPEFYLCTLYHAKKQLKAVRAALSFGFAGAEKLCTDPRVRDGAEQSPGRDQLHDGEGQDRCAARPLSSRQPLNR